MIRKVRRDAYPIFTSPAAAGFCRQQQWYAADDGSVLGIVALDLIDKDYNRVVLAIAPGEPEYRAVDVKCSYPDIAAAVADLMRATRISPRDENNPGPNAAAGVAASSCPRAPAGRRIFLQNARPDSEILLGKFRHGGGPMRHGADRETLGMRSYRTTTGRTIP